MKQTAFVIATCLALCAGTLAQESRHSTTLDDQTDLALTAYNNGLALVRDVRTLSLPTGELHLHFNDVAEQIRPETVSLRSISAPGTVSILEQNYEYDLMSPAKLMEKFVGQNVRLVNFSNQLGFEEVDAKLLSANDGYIYRVGSEIFLGHPGTVVLPEIPANLIARPSLIWAVDNAEAKQTLEATYLTRGITWKADYVSTLAKDDSSLDLAGWVTMNNQSGATYENTRLKLVAGAVNIVPDRMAKVGRGGARGVRVEAMAMPVEESFAEYHLYTMPRRTTIKQNQSKQLALMDASGVASKKRYEYRGQAHFYSQPMPPILGQNISVFLDFENEEENELGVPLPGGIMRIYQEDSEGMLQFAGEDRIQHTPKDETVTLRMGQAFDVIGERVQTDYRRIASNVHEAEFEITLRNHKETDIVVDVVEPMPGDWEILRQSHDHTKKDANTAVFSMPVAHDGEAVLTYRVRMRN
jgi:hypothetical protein